MALLSALLCGLASPTFIGCKDYDDDIKDLQEQITANKTSIDELLGKIKEGQFVQGVEKIANGLKVLMEMTEMMVRFLHLKSKKTDTCMRLMRGKILLI